MNYLILGGAGFIGTNLSKRLISEGHNVCIIDNCSTSNIPNYEVQFHNLDIRLFDDLEKFIIDSDIIYFLAGSVGVKYVIENPYSTLTNNIDLAMKVVPLVTKNKKLLIFSSTSEVYGNGPFSETDELSIGPPTNLRWGYASVKLTTEFFVASSGTPYRILRLFNITGPGQLGDYGMVLPRFVSAAKNNEDIIVYGDGTQYRSFCHIQDAVTMMRQVELAPDGIYNLGNDQSITILELAKKVKKILNSKSKIIFKPLNQIYLNNSGDIHHRIPDLSKIRSTIEYKITRSLEDIIRDMSND